MSSCPEIAYGKKTEEWKKHLSTYRKLKVLFKHRIEVLLGDLGLDDIMNSWEEGEDELARLNDNE